LVRKLEILGIREGGKNMKYIKKHNDTFVPFHEDDFAKDVCWIDDSGMNVIGWDSAKEGWGIIHTFKKPIYKKREGIFFKIRIPLWVLLVIIGIYYMDIWMGWLESLKFWA